MDWKDLEKMTVTRLREEAVKYPEKITGVRGKDKAELMDELAGVLGIEKPHISFTARVAQTKDEIKHRIKDLKVQRDQLITEHRHKELKSVRRQIHNLKHQIRQIEEEDARKVKA